LKRSFVRGINEAMNKLDKTQKLRYLPRGIVENEEGLVAGMWIRGKKDKREVFLLDKPVKRTKSAYRIVHKSVSIDGELRHDVPVKEYISVNAVNHWGKYSDNKQKT